MEKVCLYWSAILTILHEISKTICNGQFVRSALTVSNLCFNHRDPIDRIIIAQAVNSNLQILTKDAAFKNYGVSIVW